MSKRRNTARNRGGLDEDGDTYMAPSGWEARGDGENSGGGTAASLRVRGAAAKRAGGVDRRLQEASTRRRSKASIRCCAHDSCARRPYFNVEGGKRAVYCREHAKDGMVDILSKSCSHGSCQTRPHFNFEGKAAEHCAKHAEEGMVHVLRQRCCSHDSCTKQPNFGVEGGRTAVYCKPHALDGMVNVFRRHCSHSSCTREPYFNVDGSKKGVYCMEHAEQGMLNIRSKRCSRDSCTKRPSWGVLTDGAPTVCAFHKNDILGGLAVSFRKRCEAVHCKNPSRWGLDGKQPTHCLEHGPRTEGLVQTVEANTGKRRLAPPLPVT